MHSAYADVLCTWPDAFLVPFPIAAGIAAGAGLAGGLLGNAASAHEAYLNRRFQKNMSNTEYQRGVADMKAAGLNPALAYQQGGASTPSGSTASQDDPIAGGIKGAATGVDMVQRQAQTLSTLADTRKSVAEAKYLEAIGSERVSQFQAGGRKLGYEVGIAGQREAQEAVKTDFDTLAAGPRMKLLRGGVELQGKHIAGASLANQLAGLEIPEAAAMANFYRSEGGQIMPWVNSGLSVMQRLRDMLPSFGVKQGFNKSYPRRRMRP